MVFIKHGLVWDYTKRERIMFFLSLFFLLFLQIDSDDVLTRDEQIFLLISARARCERNIRAQLDVVRGIIIFV